MHSHGDRGFVNPSGVSAGSDNVGSSSNSGAGSNSPGYAAANKACEHLPPNNGGPPTAAETQREVAEALKWVQCIRTHGVPDMPDPTFQGGEVYQNLPAGVDKDSPTWQAAQTACQSLLPIQ